MGKRCVNCANGTWLKGNCAVTEVCLECEYVHAEPSNWKEKVMTNADRIRSMTDEELADILREFAVKPMQGSFLKWLKQPAEEETE